MEGYGSFQTQVTVSFQPAGEDLKAFKSGLFSLLSLSQSLPPCVLTYIKQGF